MFLFGDMRPGLEQENIHAQDDASVNVLAAVRDLAVKPSPIHCFLRCDVTCVSRCICHYISRMERSVDAIFPAKPCHDIVEAVNAKTPLPETRTGRAVRVWDGVRAEGRSPAFCHSQMKKRRGEREREYTTHTHTTWTSPPGRRAHDARGTLTI